MSMSSIQQTLAKTCDQLSSVTDTPLLEAEILVSFVLAKPRSYLHAWPEINLSNEQMNLLQSYVDRRLKREPMAYITGHKEFWSLDLKVREGVLVPRPETEVLVDEVLKLFSDQAQVLTVADLGTGSGAIALALAHERPAWDVYAVDISESALNVIRDNAQRLGIDNISFYLGNWFTALPSEKLDIVVSNPPYISEQEWAEYADNLKFEPRAALTSGEDGLDAIREICRSAHQYLKPCGYLVIEHGFSQGQAVRELFSAAGYSAIRTISDLSGLERVTLGQLQNVL